MDILCTVIAALIIVYILISHIHVICYGFVLILAIYLLYLLQDEYRCGIVTSDVYCDIINKFISIIYILWMCTIAIINIQSCIFDEQLDEAFYYENFSSYIDNHFWSGFEYVYSNTLENNSDEIYFFSSIESSNPNEDESDPSGGDSNPSGDDSDSSEYGSNYSGDGSNPSGGDSNPSGVILTLVVVILTQMVVILTQMVMILILMVMILTLMRNGLVKVKVKQYLTILNLKNSTMKKAQVI
jgi:hypothetical protein